MKIQTTATPKKIASLAKPISENLISLPKDALAILNSAGEIEGFGISLGCNDLDRLQPGVWLNDSIINFYIYLILLKANGLKSLAHDEIQIRECMEKCKVYIANTFLFTFFRETGFEHLKKWTGSKGNFLDFDLLEKFIIPIHLGVHWICAIINIKAKTITMNDSQKNSSDSSFDLGKVVKRLFLKMVSYYKDLVLKQVIKKSAFLESFEGGEWTVVVNHELPRQNNGYDCGVFALVCISISAFDLNVTYSQSDMKYFRQRILYEIKTKKLLW